MWSGPLAATMFSVPPLTGLAVLEAVGALAAEPELDELEHAARPMATAVAATAIPATRLDTLVMRHVPFWSTQVRLDGDCPVLMITAPPQRLSATQAGIQPKIQAVARL